MIRLAKPDGGETSGDGPRFAVGQLVRHVRYGYRGVVVHFDRYCMAPDHWYYGNQTQPDRNQPWYHVLVHGAATVTYAAQTSLTEEDAPEPIDHPLVEKFFSDFTGDRYVRNDAKWPG
jgi:heat shock protein HspQ